MPNIFEMLAADHREVESLLTQFEATEDTPTDEAAREHLAGQLVILGSRHEASEELVLWPVVRRQITGDGGALADTALRQEREARYILDTLRVAASDASRRRLVAEFAAATRTHIAYEEQTVWPQLRRHTTRIGTAFLGAKLSAAGRLAPTRPHPGGPDRPVGLLTAGMAAATMDRMRDRMSRRRLDTAVQEERPPQVTGDAIAVLRADHHHIEVLLDRLAGRPDAALLRQLVRALSVHDVVEREHLYPLVRDRLATGNQLAARSFEEHASVARLLGEIDRRRPSDPGVPGFVAELGPLVRGHFAWEEQEVFAELRIRLAGAELDDLGAVIAAAQQRAPTHPHPHLPAVGGRLVSGALAPLDRARDAWRARR